MKNRLLSKSTTIRLMCCVLLLTMLSISLIGCNQSDYTVVGDFEVQIFETAYVNTYRISAISKTAKNKEELVIPNELNGIPVSALGSQFGPIFDSPNLKKLFWAGDQKLNNKRIIDSCPELDIVVFTSLMPTSYKEFFTEDYAWAFRPSAEPKSIQIILLNEVKDWMVEYKVLDEIRWLIDYKEYYVPEYIINSPSPNVYFYRNYSATISEFCDKFKCEWLLSTYSKVMNDEALLEKINKQLDGSFDKDTLNSFNDLDDYCNFFYTFLSEHFYEELTTDLDIIRCANCFWIDYIEAGEKIKTMPPEPTREGYKFTGWYSDENCTNKVNLQTVVKADSDLSFYAGWEEI